MYRNTSGTEDPMAPEVGRKAPEQRNIRKGFSTVP